MAVTVKKARLWRKEVSNRPGALAETLAPLADAGANLKVVIGYAMAENQSAGGVVEVFPVSGKRQNEAARNAGLTEGSAPCLIVEGDDRPGLGHKIAQAIGDAGINLSFVVAQVVGRKFSAVLGFDSEPDATRAAGLIRRIGTAKKR